MNADQIRSAEQRMGMSSRREREGDEGLVVQRKKSTAAVGTMTEYERTTSVGVNGFARSNSVVFPFARITVAQHEESNDLVRRSVRGA